MTTSLDASGYRTGPQPRAQIGAVAGTDGWSEPGPAGPHSPLPAPDTLAAPDTALIGREPEIARLTAMVEVPGLVTVTGEGGVGKTRVVVEVARRQTQPVVSVPLADLDRTGATLAIRRICAPLLLSRLDMAAGTLLDPSTQTRDAVRPGPPVTPSAGLRLLVLDSVEQVGQISELIAEIRSAAPDLTILVTSRSRLGLSNERVLHLVGLPTGDDGPAVELFLTRSRAIGADPAVMGSQLAAIAELCRALDGVPLAIELAAARTRMMSPTALLAQLHSPNHRRVLTLLAKGPTDLPKRQLSMRATLTWSHQLLDPAHQVLFRRLGIFPGSFSLDAAEAIVGCADPDVGPHVEPGSEADVPAEAAGGQPEDVLNGIAEMVDLHLIEPVDSSADPERIRFIMSDVARAFAAELLAACDDAPAVRARLRRWCLDLVARADRGLASIDEQLWLDRLTRELPIIRQCLAACAADGHGVAGLQLCVGLGRYWALRACTNEGLRWLEIFLDATAGAGEPGRPVAPDALIRSRTAALAWCSRLAIGSGDLALVGAGLPSLWEARPAAIEASSTLEWLTWTDNLVLGLFVVGQAAECGSLIADGLRTAEAHRDPYWTCVFLLHRAVWRWAAVGQREDRLAFLWAEVAYMAAADYGLDRLAARAKSLSAMNLMARRDWFGARDAMAQTLDGLRRGGDDRSHAVSLTFLGAIMIELERPHEAARYLVEAIAEAKRNDDRLGEIGAAWAVSFLACRLGRHADVAVAHDAVAEHLGMLEWLFPAALLEDYQLALAGCRPSGVGAGDGGDTPSGGWLRGWAMGVASQVAALEPPDDGAVPPRLPQPVNAGTVERRVAAVEAAAATPATSARPYNLTARELEVLAAIASGRTNAQIATDFFLSTKTVMHHSVSIYRKLEVRGRAEAVALAYRSGLLQEPVG